MSQTKYQLTSIITTINIVIVGLSPLFALILWYFKFGEFPLTPWWGRGVFISWAFTFNLWMGLGKLFDTKIKKVTTINFTIANLLIPIVGVFLFRSADIITNWYYIATYHFFALAIALMSLVIVGPFIKKKNSIHGNPMEDVYTIKRFKTKKDMGASLGFIPFGVIIFGFAVVLPSFWTESFVLSEQFSNIPNLLIRYVGVLVDIYILFKIMFTNSIYND